MNKLLNLGFQPVGEWVLENDTIRPVIHQHAQVSNVLYCFVVDTEIKYFGTTLKTLSNRMNGYSNPGVSQTTNIRLNGYIKEALENNACVQILVFIDLGIFSYGGFTVNLSLGLEYALIKEYKNLWNIRGNNQILVIEHDEIVEEQTNDETSISGKTFQINIVETYLKAGFINIPKQYADLFGDEGEEIQVNFNKVQHNAKIYRISNHGQPRIYIGKELKDWLEKANAVGKLMQIELINNSAIMLTVI